MGTFRIPLSARCTPTVRFCACRHNTALRDKCLYRKNGQLWRVETGRFDQQMSAGFAVRFASLMLWWLHRLSVGLIGRCVDVLMPVCEDASIEGETKHHRTVA
jgi:hypothetical protein